MGRRKPKPINISGFTFIKNASKLYIPLKQSIESVLPLVDEFVVAMGDNDPGDLTYEWIDSIESDKIKIVRTRWDIDTYAKNTEFARQTDIAKSHCQGKWLFYIQADEAVHENDLPFIKKMFDKYEEDERVDGFLFQYKHFWGDYEHYHKSHCWYPKEIRIIKNKSEIHSWRDAQSFRKFNQFDGTYHDYMREDGAKLNVIELPCTIFHYGYVRPPKMMSFKQKVAHESYHGVEGSAKITKKAPPVFDYGDLSKLQDFDINLHPKAMESWITQLNWKQDLTFDKSKQKNRPLHCHEKLKSRVVSWLENNIIKGQVGGFKNYNIIHKEN